MHPVPLDELPIHQVPASMRHVGTGDRNFYDRSYFNAHDRTGDLFLVTGLGVYPNLGVIDAYATLRIEDRQITVRTSDALGDDRSDQTVGPYRVEVVEPLRVIRLICEGDEHGLGFDLTWEGSFAAIEESSHLLRQAGRVILDAQRFAQVGTWSGELRVEGRTIAVTPDTWLGTRDRSWGIRPIGEPEPPGRAAAEMFPAFGFWWTYVPLRFDDFALVLIMQEDGDGTRSFNDAVRIWPAASDRVPEQLGWPQVEIRYRSGTRHPEGATIRLVARDGAPLILEVETLGSVVLSAGPGYGGDPEWTHGQWRGRGWVEGSVVDLSDPDVQARLPFNMIDHVARATLDGVEGWGMFEHGVIGRHTPSGFADLGSVAP